MRKAKTDLLSPRATGQRFLKDWNTCAATRCPDSVEFFPRLLIECLRMSLPPSSPFKRFLDRFVPFLYRPVRRTYQWQGERRFQRRYRRLVGQITAKAGWQVQTGPFTGMHYIEEARSSALLPKLLGTYEDESPIPTLEAFLAAAVPHRDRHGCAEGYYAVGLARRMPACDYSRIRSGAEVPVSLHQTCDSEWGCRPGAHSRSLHS